MIDINNFHVVLGGDGAPFGKDSTACTWLISFINRGKSILSNTENFMIFGANCEENSVVIVRYVKITLHEITEIEKKVFNTLYMEQMLGSLFLNFQII